MNENDFLFYLENKLLRQGQIFLKDLDINGTNLKSVSLRNFMLWPGQHFFQKTLDLERQYK